MLTVEEQQAIWDRALVDHAFAMVVINIIVRNQGRDNGERLRKAMQIQHIEDQSKQN